MKPVTNHDFHDYEACSRPLEGSNFQFIVDILSINIYRQLALIQLETMNDNPHKSTQSKITASIRLDNEVNSPMTSLPETSSDRVDDFTKAKPEHVYHIRRLMVIPQLRVSFTPKSCTHIFHYISICFQNFHVHMHNYLYLFIYLFIISLLCLFFSCFLFIHVLIYLFVLFIYLITEFTIYRTACACVSILSRYVVF